MGIGFGSGLGGFAQGVSNGINTGIGLVRLQDQQKEEKARDAYLNTMTQERNIALQKDQQQQDEANYEKSLGNDALTNYQQGQSDGSVPASTPYADYWRQNVLPQVIDHKLANGDPAGAVALDQWGKNEQKTSLIDNMGRMYGAAANAQQTGDFTSVNGAIKNVWNNLDPAITNGTKFQRIEVTKSPGGSQSVNAVYAGPDGKIVKQPYNSVSDLVQHIGDLSHPQDMFERERAAGLLGPLVSARAGGQLPSAAQQQPAAPSADDAEFNPAPLNSTANTDATAALAPSMQVAAQAAAGGASQPPGAQPAIPVQRPAVIPAAPDPTDTSAQPAALAPSAVNPLSPSVQAPDAAATGIIPGQSDAAAALAPPANTDATAALAPSMQVAAQAAAGGAGARSGRSNTAPHITIVPTRPVSPDVTAAAAPQAPGVPQVGLTPEVHNAVVAGLASGDPEAKALAMQVIAQYAPPKYDIKTLVDGSVVAINPGNPADIQTIYHANAQSAETAAALTADAERYRQTGTLPPNMGRGQQGQALAASIRNKAAELETSAGGDTSTWPARWAQFKAQKGYSGTVDNIVEGIKNGSQPPDLAHLGQLSAPVSGELEKSGFNLAQAQVDWKRAQKQIASLNGPQMTRFVGLANSVTNTINEVNDLAGKMNMSGIPALNRVQMQAYVQANGNSENGQLVTRYLTSVNTLKEEFASLAQGGYAPTESAWGLANTQINGNFGVKQLGASLGEVQRLINYRLHAFNNMDTEGPGAPNRYTGGGAQPASAAPPAMGSAPAGAVPAAPLTSGTTSSGVKWGIVQ